MHETIAGNEGAVMNNGVAAQQRSIGQNHVVADAAIVRHVRIRHEEIIRADDRVLFIFVRAMNRNMFAKDISFADAEFCWLAFVFQILRGVADDATGVKMIIRAIVVNPVR